jgi:hypothetical protein
MKRYFLFSLPILFFVSIEINAQSGFRDGYVITSRNDTLIGQIDNKFNTVSENACRFRKGSETQVYTPYQILGYGFRNERYFSSQIIIGSFVEVLIDGELSLFKSGYDFYVQKTGGEVVKIESKKILDTLEVETARGKEEVVGFRDDLRWKGMLSILTTDCPAIYMMIQKMKLEEKDLTKFAVKYNLCKSSPYRDFKSGKPWIRFGFGVSAGMALSNLKFSNQDYEHSYLAESYQSSDPTFGLSFEVSSPRINERIALQTELSYIKTSYYSNVIVPRKNQTEAYFETYFDFSTLAVPVIAKYTFTREKYSLFMGAGAEFDFTLNANYRLNTEIVEGNTVDSYESDLMDVKMFPMGIVGEIGLTRVIGKMSIGTILKYYETGLLRKNLGNDSDLSRISISLILKVR